ncbi:MAG: hypothetical protein A2158_01315 [Chloroflexi bacterium RBG_13_46_14]|nr:MAG: hypothetical protein A2158_01315 [Chloroflexi bacterium RBG_13_46_14]
MDRELDQWTIKNLVEKKRPFLGFPEFQREPTVWDLKKKQKLIDSILRNYDIAPIYLYKKDEYNFECIDGRQRINAIYSFVGVNDDNNKEANNKFKMSIENEIYDDTDFPFMSLSGATYEDLENDDNQKEHKEYKDAFDNFNEYKLNIVLLSSDTDNEEKNEQELSLQFIRLNLLSALNAGEKLHAMSGNMRNFIFNELFTEIPGEQKRKHPFFKSIKIPYRRYAKEQVAAQIALNYFSLMTPPNTFSRSRYIDLQYFFKRKTKFNDNDTRLTKEILEILNIIVQHLDEALTIIRNRAIAVSTFLYIAESIYNEEEKKVDSEKAKEILPQFKDFLIEFLATLKWQLSLYRSANQNHQYREIFTDFQNYITNAAGESYALTRRHAFIKKYFNHYRDNNEIIGDSQYFTDTGRNAKAERANFISGQLELPEG